MADVEQGQAVADVQVHHLEQIPVAIEPEDDGALEDQNEATRRLALATEDAAIRTRWIKTVFSTTTKWVTLLLATILAGCIVLHYSPDVIAKYILTPAIFMFVFSFLIVTIAQHTSVDASSELTLPIWAAVVLTITAVCVLISRQPLALLAMYSIQELFLLHELARITQRLYGGYRVQYNPRDEEITAGVVCELSINLLMIWLVASILVDLRIKIMISSSM